MVGDVVGHDIAAAPLAALPVEAFFDAVLDELVDEHPEDDVAVVAVRIPVRD
jgi:hypothetical protein